MAKGRNFAKRATGEAIENEEKKKRHYQSDSVASKDDDIRFTKLSHRLRNRRKLDAVQKAIAAARDLGWEIKSVVDIPCGTGRVFPLFLNNEITFTGADLSGEMMTVAKKRFGQSGLMQGMVRCDAEFLPFKNKSIDSVVSIRFMFHIPESVRHNILREMTRISKGCLIIDYRS